VIDLTTEELDKTAIRIGSNLDIEVVQTISASGKMMCAYQPPACAKQANLSSTSAPNPKQLKLAGSLNKPTPLHSCAPCALAGLSTLKTPPNLVCSALTMVPSSGDSPQDKKQLKHNTVTLAILALRQLIAALKLVKGRREMAMRLLHANLQNFLQLGLLILRMVWVTPPTAMAPPGRIMAKFLNERREEENNKQKLEWIVAGWEPLKLTWDLLTNS
jgi:hypothetical protein